MNKTLAIKKPPLLAKLYLGPFEKAKLIVIQGKRKKFLLFGHWEIQSVSDQGVGVGIWFYTKKWKADPTEITPEEKQNCYLIYQTGEVEAETKVPEEEVKELHCLWSMGIQSGVNTALAHLNKRGLFPDVIQPEVPKRVGKSNRLYNLRGESIL